MLSVPMLREGNPTGVITVAKCEPTPFADRQIELLKTFADQAAIAIENARLFKEVQTRTRELARTVDELKSLSEIGQTVSSTLDLKAVLNAILMHACRLADAGGGAVYVFDAARREFNLEAGYNMSEELMAAVRKRPIGLSDPACRAVRETARGGATCRPRSSATEPALRDAYEVGRTGAPCGAADPPG